MKLINANLKSENEALHRMIDGEVFFYSNLTISWDIYNNCMSFVDDIGRDQKIDFNNVAEWKKEASWEDFVKAGGKVLCNAWDDDEDDYSVVYIHEIRENTDYKYVSDYILGTTEWRHATPIAESDIWVKDDD